MEFTQLPKLPKLLAVGLAAIATTFAQAQEITWRPLYEPGSGGRIAGLGVSPHDSNHGSGIATS
jgi:hypothetical protein